MNNRISEILKKLTICMMVLVFSFILLAPTANALRYDPDRYRIIGDGDPWNELEIYKPPPPDDFDILTMLTIFILKKYDYFQYEQKVDTNNRKIINKQRDESISN